MMKQLLLSIFAAIALISCNKDEVPEDSPNSSSASCSTNSGTFEIEVEGVNHTLQLTNETHYSIVYNWFGNEETSFVIYGENQNGQTLDVEFGIAGVIEEGNFNYGSELFFQLSLDTTSFSPTQTNLEVLESDLSANEGIYKPIRANFSGTGVEKVWDNGQQISTNKSFSGSFCLNGIIQ